LPEGGHHATERKGHKGHRRGHLPDPPEEAPVRLARVNAPEKGKKGAAQARKDLEKLILNQDVTIQTVARDKYRRAVANVKLGRNSVNKAMKEKL